ncbi:MAG: hypothetical protein ACO3EE_08985 [Flavobacteriales bacterium]
MRKLAVILLLLLFNANSIFAQCSQCKMSLETSKPAGDGFNSGILLLMIIPYLLLTTVIWIFFRKKIKEKVKSILHRK